MTRIRALTLNCVKSAVAKKIYHHLFLSNHQRNVGSHAKADWGPKVLSLKGNLVEVLKGSVLYENEKIICLNKPAGVHGYTTKSRISNDSTTQVKESLTVEDVLYQLAKDQNCESLRVCHAPHPLYSGATILAKNDAAASMLQSVFRLAKRRDENIKTDLALTIGVPSPRSGLIKVPVEKKEINGKIYALPVFNAGKAKMKKKGVKKRRTSYNVLGSSRGMALVELQPRDGLGQLSLLHITCKLCQVLGDKEFSNRVVKVNGVRMFLDADKAEIGTQKLTPRIRHLLGLQDEEDVRNLPLFVHRWKVSLPQNPELDLSEDITITAPLPKYFSNTLQHLGINDPSS